MQTNAQMQKNINISVEINSSLSTFYSCLEDTIKSVNSWMPTGHTRRIGTVSVTLAGIRIAEIELCGFDLLLHWGTFSSCSRLKKGINKRLTRINFSNLLWVWLQLSFRHASQHRRESVSFYLLCLQTSSFINFFSLTDIQSMFFPLCYLYRCYVQFAFYHTFFFFPKAIYFRFQAYIWHAVSCIHSGCVINYVINLVTYSPHSSCS